MATTARHSPLAAQRKLAEELRALRDRYGLTTVEVAEHLGCHNSKVSRLENAKRACAKADFNSLMQLYEVQGNRLAELEALMTRGLQRRHPWWHAYRDVISNSYAEFIAYEAEATACWEYQPLLIPGLLQSKDYARAITGSGIAALGPDQIDTLVEVRMRRQERLRDHEPLSLVCLITEAALRLRVGGPEVMRAQLRHLVQLTELTNVELRIIPFEAGEKGASTGAFTLAKTGNNVETDVAFTESAEATTHFRDDPLALKRLNRLFTNLSNAALSVHAGLELIACIEKELI